MGKKMASSLRFSCFLKSRLWTWGMPSLLGKHGSIDPLLAPSLYNSSVEKSEYTRFFAGTPRASKYALNNGLVEYAFNTLGIPIRSVLRFPISSARFF